MSEFLFEIKRVITPYLSINGGPIVLAQIENEYHENDPGGQDYIQWCGELTKQLDMNVSWVMCNGMSAPDTINTVCDIYIYIPLFVSYLL